MENGGEPQARDPRKWALACAIAGAVGVVLFVLVAVASRRWVEWVWVVLLVPYTAINWARYRRLKPQGPSGPS